MDESNIPLNIHESYADETQNQTKEAIIYNGIEESTKIELDLQIQESIKHMPNLQLDDEDDNFKLPVISKSNS